MPPRAALPDPIETIPRFETALARTLPTLAKDSDYNLPGQFEIEELNRSGKLDTEVPRVQAARRFYEAAKSGTYGAVKLLRDPNGDGCLDAAILFPGVVLYARNARGQVVAVALPWTARETARPRLEIQRVEADVELNWPVETSDWALEQYLPARAGEGWHTPPPESGELAPGRYRTTPAEEAAWFRLRQP